MWTKDIVRTRCLTQHKELFLFYSRSKTFPAPQSRSQTEITVGLPSPHVIVQSSCAPRVVWKLTTDQSKLLSRCCWSIWYIKKLLTTYYCPFVLIHCWFWCSCDLCTHVLPNERRISWFLWPGVCQWLANYLAPHFIYACFAPYRALVLGFVFKKFEIMRSVRHGLAHIHGIVRHSELTILCTISWHVSK